MKFSIDSKKFLEVIKVVEKASASKTTLPTLEGILIRSNGSDKISIMCTNLELSIDTEVDAIVEEEGAICVTAKTLEQMVNQFDGLILVSTEEKQKVVISGNGARYELMSYKSEDFPDIMAPETTESFEISQNIFGDMIKQTIFAVSKDESKGIHCGLRFELENNLLRLVALDGYRFAIRENEIDYFDNNIDFVVKESSMKEVLSIIKNIDDKIIVEKGQSKVVFIVNGYRIISPILEGNYLDFRRAIPNTASFTIDMNTAEFISHIKRCAVVINDKNKVPIKLKFSNNKLEMAADTILGSAKSSFNVDYTNDDEFIIGFNSSFLLDALNACIEDEFISISMLSPQSPAVIRTKNKVHLILAVKF